MDGELFSTPPPTHRAAPRVETLTIHAAALEHAFVVHVVLPRDYDVVTERVYPVVILNDGQNQFTERGMWGGWHADSTAARLMRAGRMGDSVLVAVEMHPDRNRAYLPQGDARAPAGQAAEYTDFLADQVLPQLRRSYRIASGPEHTAIVGSSNGAIHALYAGLRRPDTFGLVGCLSYARLQPEQNCLALDALTTVPLQRVYVDSGSRWGEDDPHGSSDDHALITAGLRERLLQRGLVLEQSLRYRLAYGEAHHEGAWRRRLPDCLEFLLPPA
jgi:predicted alpha/beta superfamily hydrolase